MAFAFFRGECEVFGFVAATESVGSADSDDWEGTVADFAASGRNHVVKGHDAVDGQE